MSRTYKDSTKNGRRPRRVSVRAVRRESPDLRALRRAIVAQAMLEAAAEAAAEADDTLPAQDSASTLEPDDE